MARRGNRLNPLDAVFFERALELGDRGAGNTMPNPPVGAVLACDGTVGGEGYHHRAGGEHAEVIALQAAGERARGATLYVTLEPCNHFGRTPPCTETIVAAGVRRVVAGCADPNPATAGGGFDRLRASGIEVEVLYDGRARRLIEPFAATIASPLPYVGLKLATSLDGYVTSRPRAREWLTGDESRGFVRDLRSRFDAVMVGAGTVRADNPQLTVRPPHDRVRPYVRVVVCETEPVAGDSRVFAQQDGYAKTILVAPAAKRDRFGELERIADVLYVAEGGANTPALDSVLRALRDRGIFTILCEGGPTLGSRLIAADLVHRFYWIVAPISLYGPQAVPALQNITLANVPGFGYDGVERLGRDMLLTGTFERV